MSIFKCKMCGGTIEFESGATVGVCDSCGTKQTLPRLDTDRKANLYDRANHFRRNNEFDKAMGIYESILNEDSTDAEAYWSVVLCRYGIEYVEDPASRQRIPTVNRAQYTSIFDDEDYKSALSYADVYQRQLYEDEAKTINEIQKGILEISQKEEPFDVFISFKETGADGRRTRDTVLAHELYNELIKEGYKVFFAPVTLEDKLGEAYEPYIFAALNTAKVMVVLGTKPEHFNAVWVKNEWSRYLSLIKNGANKTLIPAYKDMDPYDLPEEFSHLMAQDMSKLGFMQDLIRGIKKLTAADSQSIGTHKETVVVSAPVSSVAPLLERAFMFLEDENWADADAYCEKVLDIEPKNAQAYLGKLMAELHVTNQEKLADCAEPFVNNGNYKKVVRFADESLIKQFDEYNRTISERNENARKEEIYTRAKSLMSSAKSESDFNEVAMLFDSIKEYKDSIILVQECNNKAEEDRIAAEKAEKERKKTKAIACAVAALLFAAILIVTTVIVPSNQYKEAESLFADGDYKNAIVMFEALGDYKDSAKRAEEASVLKPKADAYAEAEALLASGDKARAAMKFATIPEYKDGKERSRSLWNEVAQRNTISAGDYFTVALKSDGTVVAVGNNECGQCNVSGWKDIIAVSAGGGHTVGLKDDGTVLAAGYKKDGQCNVFGLTDIVAVSAGYDHTVGLKADGTVVAMGDDGFGKCNVSDWTDIVAVSAGGLHTVGLKADGTVLAAGVNGWGQCNVSGWTDIVAVATGERHTVGLKADGTVLAMGKNKDDQCDVSGWRDIVAVSAGGYHTVGLKADGTVVAAGNNEYGQCNVSDWTDIVAVSAGWIHTVGLKADGTVVAVGGNDNGECNVSGWKDIKVPER